MAVTIPLYLINRTGPEWQKFMQDAERAGVAANDAANQLVKMANAANKQEAMKSLAKSTGLATDSVSGLVDKINYLNALNITPYGYERFAYRLSMMFSQLGKASAPVAAVGVAVGTVAMAVKALGQTGDANLTKLKWQIEELSAAWTVASARMGKTEFVQGGIRGLTESIKNLAEMTNEWDVVLRGAMARFTGNDAGLRAAGAEAAKRRKELADFQERQRVKDGEDTIREFRDGVDQADRKKEIARINDLREIARLQDDERARFREMMKDEKDESHRMRLKKQFMFEMNELDARGREIQRHDLEMRKQSLEIDRQRKALSEQRAVELGSVDIEASARRDAISGQFRAQGLAARMNNEMRRIDETERAGGVTPGVADGQRRAVSQRMADELIVKATTEYQRQKGVIEETLNLDEQRLKAAKQRAEEEKRAAKSFEEQDAAQRRATEAQAELDELAHRRKMQHKEIEAQRDEEIEQANQQRMMMNQEIAINAARREFEQKIALLQQEQEFRRKQALGDQGDGAGGLLGSIRSKISDDDVLQKVVRQRQDVALQQARQGGRNISAAQERAIRQRAERLTRLQAKQGLNDKALRQREAAARKDLRDRNAKNMRDMRGKSPAERAAAMRRNAIERAELARRIRSGEFRRDEVQKLDGGIGGIGRAEADKARGELAGNVVDNMGKLGLLSENQIQMMQKQNAAMVNMAGLLQEQAANQAVIENQINNVMQMLGVARNGNSRGRAQRGGLRN